MSKRQRWPKFIGSVVLLTVILTQYQNCAPAGPGVDSEGNLVQTSSLADIIVDSTTPFKLQFNEKSIQLPVASSDLEAHGTCLESQEGATLRWELYDAGDEVVHDGYVDCVDGGFTVALSDLSSMSCGEEYLLEARLGLGEAGQVPLMIECD